ncbi:hypothetical protein Moror_5247 [Moniliophthora roreri MCA 2997]|uniref:Uncharacterized protein n=1 Tax=Moniliophthora roreri (strain MCA 2997) TaxID=1381753 RepID=V2X5W7_MONRO|nr:hypothetical protein Moror_5247 [Moniliophthora roreri MCA 2997]
MECTLIAIKSCQTCYETRCDPPQSSPRTGSTTSTTMTNPTSVALTRIDVGLKPGAMAGVVITTALAVIALLLLTVYCVRRGRSKKTWRNVETCSGLLNRIANRAGISRKCEVWLVSHLERRKLETLQSFCTSGHHREIPTKIHRPRLSLPPTISLPFKTGLLHWPRSRRYQHCILLKPVTRPRKAKLCIGTMTTVQCVLQLRPCFARFIDIGLSRKELASWILGSPTENCWPRSISLRTGRSEGLFSTKP